MALKKRGTVWYTYFYKKTDAGRKKVWVSLNTQSQLIAMERALELTKSRSAEASGVAPADAPLEPIYQRYLDFRASDVKAKTVAGDKYAINLFKAFSPIKTVGEINQGTVDDFKIYLKNRGIGATHRNKAMDAIRRVLVFGAERNLCKHPEWKPRKDSENERRAKKDYFNMGEVQRLMAIAKDGMETVILLGVFAGLRPDEIWSLRTEDVDFPGKRIKIRRQDDWTPKRGKERDIPLQPDLEEHLKGILTDGRGYVVRLKFLRRSMPDNHPDRWFNGRPKSSAQIGKLFSTLLRRARIVGVPYTLRHTFGTWIAASGIPLNTLKAWMGHSSITMTEHYAHSATEHHHDFIQRAPRLGVPSAGIEPATSGLENRGSIRLSYEGNS